MSVVKLPIPTALRTATVSSVAKLAITQRNVGTEGEVKVWIDIVAMEENVGIVEMIVVTVETAMIVELAVIIVEVIVIAVVVVAAVAPASPATATAIVAVAVADP